MKKNVLYYVFCLLIPFFCFFSESDAFLGFFEDSSDIQADIQKTNQEKFELQNEKKEIQNNIKKYENDLDNGKDVVDKIKKEKTKLQKIEKEIDEKYDKMTELNEKLKEKQAEEAQEKMETDEKINGINDEIKQKELKLDLLKKEEETNLSKYKDCDKNNNCKEIEDELKKFQTYISETEKEITTLEKSLPEEKKDPYAKNYDNTDLAYSDPSASTKNLETTDKEIDETRETTESKAKNETTTSPLPEKKAPRAITKPIFSGPGLVGGANLTESVLDNNISKERNLKTLIIGWTKFLYPIATLAAVVAFIWAGFLYITAMGDDGKIDSAKKIMIWTVIGLLTILGSYAIVSTIMKAAF